MPRIFIALPMDDQVRSSIMKLPKSPGVRWVEEQQYHITLKFLGEISEEQLQQVNAATHAVGSAWPQAIRLSAQGVGAFPSVQRARVLWVGLQGDTEPLVRLQQSMERALIDLGFEPEKRPFKPHITIGRMRDPAPMPKALQVHTATHFGEWTVPCVQVIQSTLRPTGPIYTVRHAVTLPDS